MVIIHYFKKKNSKHMANVICNKSLTTMYFTKKKREVSCGRCIKMLNKGGKEDVRTI